MISQRDRKADAPAQPTLMRRIMCWKVRLPAIGSPTSLRSASSLGRGQVAFPNRRLFSMLRLYRRWASGRMRRGTGVTRDCLLGIEARARDMGKTLRYIYSKMHMGSASGICNPLRTAWYQGSSATWLKHILSIALRSFWSVDQSIKLRSVLLGPSRSSHSMPERASRQIARLRSTFWRAIYLELIN